MRACEQLPIPAWVLLSSRTVVEKKAADEGTFSPRDTGRSRGGSLAILFGFLGILAVGATVYLRPVPDDTLVALAVRGCSEPCRENLALSLAFVLETQGFQVRARDGEDAETMEALSAIAEEHHAVHRLLFEVVDLQTEADSTFVEVRGAVRSANEDAVTRSIRIAVEAVQEERIETEPLRDEDAVRIEAGLMAIDALSPDLVSALLTSDVLTHYLEAEPRDTSTAITRHNDLVEAAEDDGDRRMNAGSFNAACVEVGEEYDATGDAAAGNDARGIACFTPTCEQEHLVAVDANSLIVQRDSRFPVFPLRSQHDVVTAPTPHRIFSRSETAETGEADETGDELVRARAIFGYANAAGGELAFISASDAAYSLFVTGEPEARARAQRPSILSNPKLGAEWVLFERRPFRGADPILMAAPRSGDAAPFEVTPFGVQGDWIELAAGGEQVTYVAAWVAGIRQETRAALEAQGNGERIDEAEAIDDLDDDLDAERLARIAGGLPPLDHIALVRVSSEGSEVVQRLGGRDFPLSYAQATPSGALVLIRAAGGVCELLRLEPQDWSALELSAHAESWVRLDSCPAFPVVSEHVVYGTDQVSGDGDPAEGDMEVVRYDMTTGARTQLTFNAVEERFVRLYEGNDFTRVGFERVPAPRFARFRPSGVCVFREAQVQPAPVDDGASAP